MSTRKPRIDIHRSITDHIVAAMERGEATLAMPWHQDGAPKGRPVNALTLRPYQGANVLALWIAAEVKGYSSGYWGTYRNWENMGAQVRKGERASLVVLYKEVTRHQRDTQEGEPEAAERTRYVVARSFHVFNADQVKGWQPPEQKQQTKLAVLQDAEAFIKETGARIRHGGDRACYLPDGDYITVPDRGRFVGTETISPTEGYYATVLHELVHWTAHPNRLNRDLTSRFVDSAYAMEELVAELGAAFLCADLGVSNTPRADHAGYIQHWLKVLKQDKKAIFTAANKAHQAVDYLAELQPAKQELAHEG